MLRVSLDKLITALERASGYPITIGMISEGTGVHRNIISRILNNPGSNTSTYHLNKIIEYFFVELRRYEGDDDRTLVSRIIENLFEFFPESGDHRELMERLHKAGSVNETPVSVLWEFSTHVQGKLPEPGSALAHEWEQREGTKRRLRSERRRKGN